MVEIPPKNLFIFIHLFKESNLLSLCRFLLFVNLCFSGAINTLKLIFYDVNYEKQVSMARKAGKRKRNICQKSILEIFIFSVDKKKIFR